MFYLKRGEREHIVEFLLFLVLTSPNSTFLNPRFQNVKFLIQAIQRLYSINDTNTYKHSDLTENVTRSFESEIIYSQKANDRYKKPDISVYRKNPRQNYNLKFLFAMHCHIILDYWFQSSQKTMLWSKIYHAVTTSLSGG